MPVRVRYAAAPYGQLRWKAPQTPNINRTVQDALDYGSVCFQSYPAIAGAPPMPEGKFAAHEIQIHYAQVLSANVN